MKVCHSPCDLPGLPNPDGAHRLAWSYLLDAVCADAYHAGVGQLDIQLPASFEQEIRAREPFPDTSVTGASHPAAATAATLSHVAPVDGSVIRYYRLRFGPLAPATLRAATSGTSGGGAPPDFDHIATLYVYTLRTRLLGVPMRLLNLLDRPQPADRALIALRYAFASTHPTPAYYLLETWARHEQGG